MNNDKITGFASIDKPWLKEFKEIDKDYVSKITNQSMYQMLVECSQDCLDKTAIWMPDKNYKGGPKMSYRDYLNSLKEIAKSFKTIDAKQGEIIPMILPNIYESRGSIYGLNYIGGIPYPIMPSLPPKELERILKENNIDKIIMFSGFYEKYEQVLKDCNIHCVVIADGTGILPDYLKTLLKLQNRKNKVKYNPSIMTWDEFMRIGKHMKIGNPYYEKNATATIIGTSGTTGVPKGAEFTNENVNNQAIQHLLADVNFEKGDRFLDILIQSISYGFSVMHYSACFGLTSVMVPKLISDQIVKVMISTKASHFTGGPIHYMYMRDSEEFKNGTLKPLKNAISGGAKMPKELEAELNKDAIYVKQGYGTTECLGGSTITKGTYHLGSIGIPLPLTTMGVFKPGTDEELKYNETGEICVTGPTIMKGYLHNESETNIALKKHKDGNYWLHTKDIGYVIEDGNFYFADRISDTFQRAGFNVHPSAINDFLASQEYVEDSFVYGVEHKAQQTVPVAIIVLKEKYKGKEEEIKNILINLCYNNLEEQSIPYEWIFTNNIPRNLGGKISSKDIKEMYKLDYSMNEDKLNSSVYNDEEQNIRKRTLK